MKNSILFIGLGVLALCAVGFVAFGDSDDVVAEVKQVEVGDKVLALARNVEAGQFLEAKDLKWIDYQESMAASDASYIMQSNSKASNYIGAILSHPLRKGSALFDEVVVQFGEAEFLASVLAQGMRAFTIEVDNVTGGAGLILPGNKVDVILSTIIGGNGRRSGGTQSAHTLLNNVAVIAVNKDISASSTSMAPADNKRNSKGTVTLEVTPKQAELLTVGRDSGELSLSLVNIHEQDAPSAISEVGSLTTVADIVGEKEAAQNTPVVTFYGSTAGRPQ